MKKITLLSGLFLLILFVGCQNDSINPVNPPDNTVTEDKLNKRALELFTKGVDAADAAKTLDNEFTDENKILLKALYKAGYKAAALTKAAHVTFNYN